MTLMKGDIIIVEAHHRNAARAIVDRVLSQVQAASAPFACNVAGESGSGKSETGEALREEFESRGFSAFVFQQDDYFVLPPRSNDKKRREQIGWVGTNEVRIALLDEHVAAAKARSEAVEKPLVDYDADSIGSETVDLSQVDVVIAEGTYTTLLENLDVRIFIARNRLETMASRRKRAREPIEPFLEQVLEIEHKIIAPHADRADIIITREYDVTFRD